MNVTTLNIILELKLKPFWDLIGVREADVVRLGSPQAPPIKSAHIHKKLDGTRLPGQTRNEEKMVKSG